MSMAAPKSDHGTSLQHQFSKTGCSQHSDSEDFEGCQTDYYKLRKRPFQKFYFKKVQARFCLTIPDSYDAKTIKKQTLPSRFAR